MVAIAVFLLLFRAAPFAASMAVAKTGDDRTAPDKAAMQWRAAGSSFVAREEWRQSRQGKKVAKAVAGKRSRRSRSPVRHASSSP
ncbi:MAG: hypothetical protein EOS60_31235 [Mesorhizobium sp.]|nr:MAG: hypothetical protein EOS60_31235 [Mesorhizobium sp.]